MAEQRPRPENRREFMDKLVNPYSEAGLGNPNVIESARVTPGIPEFNRSYEISQKNDDTDINVSVTLEDHDAAIQYYFDNVLKLSVYQNNQRRKVPVIYGSPERWKSVQADGYYRDKAGKIQVPLIIYRRDDIKPNRGIGNKLDGNNVKNIIVAERGFSKKDVYSNWNVLNNRVREKSYVVAFPPDYVDISYSVVMYTSFVEQMNSLIESVNFAARSYWGDPSKFQFRADIEGFVPTVSLEVGEERIVKTDFKITLSGYLIPDSLNREVAAVNRVYAPSQVALGVELSETVGEFKLEKPYK